jgi:hypothetical protein
MKNYFRPKNNCPKLTFGWKTITICNKNYIPQRLQSIPVNLLPQIHQELTAYIHQACRRFTYKSHIKEGRAPFTSDSMDDPRARVAVWGQHPKPSTAGVELEEAQGGNTPSLRRWCRAQGGPRRRRAGTTGIRRFPAGTTPTRCLFRFIGWPALDKAGALEPSYTRWSRTRIHWRHGSRTWPSCNREAGEGAA